MKIVFTILLAMFFVSPVFSQDTIEKSVYLDRSDLVDLFKEKRIKSVVPRKNDQLTGVMLDLDNNEIPFVVEDYNIKIFVKYICEKENIPFMYGKSNNKINEVEVERVTHETSSDEYMAFFVVGLFVLIAIFTILNTFLLYKSYKHNKSLQRKF